MSGSYSLGWLPGSFNTGSTWSVALQYLSGPFGLQAGLQRLNNLTPSGSASGADLTTSTGGQSDRVRPTAALQQGAQTDRSNDGPTQTADAR
jgi:predicted porin